MHNDARPSMSDGHKPLFAVFKIAQNALRGSGLGRIRAFRNLRDMIYNMVRPTQEMVIAIQNVRMVVDPNQSGVVPDLLRDGIFERCETALVRSLLSEGSVVVDVGSNIGYYTLIAAGIVGNSGRVYSIEPEPENYKYLEKNVTLNGFTNVVLIKKALSDRSETQHLYLNEDNTGGHHLADMGDGAPSVTVETITLDEYFGFAPPKVDLVKMDIEGYEPFAFRGMHSTLKANPSARLILDYYPEMIQKAGTSPDKFLDLILASDFRTSLINEVTQKVVAATRAEILEYCQRNKYANLFCVR